MWPAWLIVSLALIPLQAVHLGNPQVMYDHARQLFLHGYLEESQREAELGYAQAKYSHSDLASKLGLLDAEALLWRGMFPEALEQLSIQMPSLHDPEAVIHGLSLQGTTLTRLERLPEANQKLSDAEVLCSHEPFSTCGEVIRARGAYALEQRKLSEARQFYLDSLSFARTHHDRNLESTAFLNLGTVALAMDRYDEAVDWSRSAYQTGVALGDENQIQGALGTLASAYTNLGDSESASEMFLRAEKSATKIGNIRDRLYWQMNAGYVSMAAGNLQQAMQIYLEALQLARAIDSKEQIVYAEISLGLAAIAFGNASEAETYASQIYAMAQQIGSRPDMLAAVAIQMQAAALHGDVTRSEQLLREVEEAPETQLSMKWASEDAMSKLYEERGQAASAEKEFKAALATFEAARGGVQPEDSQLPFTANATQIYDDYIHFLVTQGKTEEALILADQSRARTLAQGLGSAANQKSFHPVSRSPQAIAAKADATLLFYWLGEKQSYLWAITPQKTSLVPLPAQRQITPLVERYRKSLLSVEDPLESGNSTGQQLYTMLVAPAAKLIRPGAPVMILADGSLSQLSFESLIVPANDAGQQPHYWIEDATLMAAPSLATLGAAKPAAKTSTYEGKLLLLGDPVSPSPEYPELPFASTEMSQIEKHFAAHDQIIFMRDRATPEAYAASNPRQFSYIHFVSHGVASRTSPLDSAIILSRANTAPYGDEDSFKLYAREIIQHPIDARVVIISGCNSSGIRAYAGEGLVGLSWAFLRAGAHSSIGALWEVSDKSTASLMDTLYQAMEDGQSPAAALRQAKLALLHSKSRFRKPFYWAPFQMYTRF